MGLRIAVVPESAQSAEYEAQDHQDGAASAAVGVN